MELQHHGIKGQKWGVRRFQNEDGSLTSSGARRYKLDENGKYKRYKSEHRIRLEDKYRSQGMSDETAKLAANRRIKTEKIIASVAGLTMTAAAAYVASKEIKYRVDSIIKDGSTLQVITNNPNKQFNKPFYASIDDKDKVRYTGKLGAFQFGYKNVHRANIKVDKNFKVASPKHAEDAFVKLYKTDPEFRNAFKKSNSEMVNSLRDRLNPKLVKMMDKSNKKMSDRDIRRFGYQAFNVGLENHSASGSSAAKKFYDYLAEQGYGGVFDVNDQKYSGYNAKKPIIVFNARGIKEPKTRLNKREIDDALRKASAMDIKSNMIKQLATSGKEVVAVASIGGMSASAIRTSAVNNYRKQHPNTKLSDEAIYKMLNKTRR